MSSVGEGRSTLELGRVIRRALTLVGDGFVPYLLMAVILVGLPSEVLGGARTILITRGSGPRFEIASYLVQVAASGLLQAAVVHRTVAGQQGRRATVMECLSVVGRRIGPLLVIEIFYFAACTGGAVLLVVPGVMMLVAWYVTIGAFVVERPGIAGAFRRSAELTRGSRWAIFGLLAMELVVLLLFSFATSYAFTVGPAVLGFATPLAVYHFAVVPLFYVGGGIFTSGLRAALYVELRQMRDGVGLQGVAAIFD